MGGYFLLEGSWRQSRLVKVVLDSSSCISVWKNSRNGRHFYLELSGAERWNVRTKKVYRSGSKACLQTREMDGNR